MKLTLDQRMTVDAVRSRVDIVALISGYVPLTRAGRLFKARCPFHDERTPSFIVSPDRQTWKCFGACGAGGDVFSFLMRAESIDFAEALRRLGDGVIAAPLPPRPIPETPPPAWLADGERYVAEYCAAFDRYAAWGKYKLLSRATIDRWELGVGVLPEYSSACQHRRLIVPTRRQGRIVALSGREMGCGCEAKYKTKWANAKGQGYLFNEDGLKPGADVVVVENRPGAALIMEWWPELVAVALGTARAKYGTAQLIADSRPKRVTVWLDNDPAGCPNDERWAAHLAECASRKFEPVAPGGPQLVNELRGYGVVAEPWRWPDGTPAKYAADDLVAELMRGQRSA